MQLHEQLETDLRTAMKQRDRARTSALRMVLAACTNRATAEGLGPHGRLDDETVIQVLSTEVKRRCEAAEAYTAAGRSDAAASELAEAAVYTSYLPEELGDDELSEIVDTAISEVDARGPGDMGRVMQLVMARTRGRADGRRVAGLVQERLRG